MTDEIGRVRDTMRAIHGVSGGSPRSYDDLIAELFVRVRRLEAQSPKDYYESDCGDTDDTRDCGGTFDPERGCHCV